MPVHEAIICSQTQSHALLPRCGAAFDLPIRILANWIGEAKTWLAYYEADVSRFTYLVLFLRQQHIFLRILFGSLVHNRHGNG